MTTSQRFAAIAAVIVVLLMVLLLFLARKQPGETHRDDPGSANAAPTTKPAAARVRVGVVISKINADAPIGNDRTGFARQYRVLAEMPGNFDFVPIIDTGSLSDPETAEVCASRFPGQTPIEASNSAEIDRFPVIVASHLMVVSPEIMESIEHAVRGGTGLVVRMFFGNRSPGANTPAVAALTGMEPEGVRYAQGLDVDCYVAGSHPILGSLSGTSQHFPASPNCMYGQYTGTPLVYVSDAGALKSGADATVPIAMLYTAELGKGKIVVMPYAGSKPPPALLDRAGAEPIGTRAVRWLAEQSAAATTQPSP